MSCVALPIDGEDEDAVNDDDKETEEGGAHGLHHVPSRGRGWVLEHGTPTREVGHIGHCLLPHHDNSEFSSTRRLDAQR